MVVEVMASVAMVTAGKEMVVVAKLTAVEVLDKGATVMAEEAKMAQEVEVPKAGQMVEEAQVKPQASRVADTVAVKVARLNSTAPLADPYTFRHPGSKDEPQIGG